MKVSAGTYLIRASGIFSSTSFPIAFSKWVFPRPGPPYINKGLYIPPKLSATARAAAFAH